MENLSEEEIIARDDHLKAIDDHKGKVEMQINDYRKKKRQVTT